jgi:hypothetical protein
MGTSVVFAWAVACCLSIEPEAPPLSLQQPYSVVKDTLIEHTYTDRETDSSYTIKMARLDITFPYRGQDGTLQVGWGRIFLPNISEPPPGGLPIAVSMHYQASMYQAASQVRRGRALLTPIRVGRDHGGNLVGDGLSHTLSLATLARRIPWVDTRRIVYYGGSAGGYHTLLTSAMRFGAACAWAELSVSDLQYNLRYLLENDNRFNEGVEDSDDWPVPIIHVVRSIGELTAAALDSTSESWWRYSAPPYMSIVGNPLAMTWSTADILVPVNQAGVQWAYPPDEGAFPEGYVLGYDSLGNDLSRGPMITYLPSEHTETFVIPTPADALRNPRHPKLKSDTAAVTTPRPPSPSMELPFSQDKRFSVLIYDEGSPDALCGHRKYRVATINQPFFAHHLEAGGPPPDAMSHDAMRYLVARWLGTDSLTSSDGEILMTRTDYEPLEHWDILLASEAYLLGGDEAVATWREAYTALPPDDRVWDVLIPAISDTVSTPITEESIRAIVREELGRARGEATQRIARAEENPLAAILYHQWLLVRTDQWDEREEVLRTRILDRFPESAYADLVRGQVEVSH